MEKNTNMGLVRPDAMPTARSLPELEADILARKRLIGANIVAIGQALIEAKAQLNHGEWGEWLREKVEFSQSSANNFMAIAREIGQDSPLAKLPYTKVLALLAVPEGEREQFAADHQVEDKSAAEIRRLIAERDEARKAEQRALAANSLQVDKLREQRKNLEAALEDLRSTKAGRDQAIMIWKKENDQLKQQLVDLQAQPPTIIREEPQDYQALKDKLARAEAEADRLADELDRAKLGEAKEETSPATRILSAIGGLMAMVGRDPAMLHTDPGMMDEADWSLVMDKVTVVGSWVSAMQQAWARREEAAG